MSHRRNQPSFPSQPERPLLNVIRIALLLASLAAIAYFMRDWRAFLSRFRGASVGPLGASFTLMLVILPVAGLLWAQLVRYLTLYRHSPEKLKLIRAFSRSWLARYVPGGAWSQAARLVHTDSRVPSRIVAASLIDEALLILVTATSLGIGLWAWGVMGSVGWLILILSIALGYALTSRIDALARRMYWVTGTLFKRRWASLAEPLNRASKDPALEPAAARLLGSGYLLINLLGGLSFWLLVASATPTRMSDILVLTGAYNIAFAVGFVALVAPAGVGVREVALVGLCSPILSAETALWAAISFRVLTVVVDVAFFLSIEAIAIGSAWLRGSGQGTSAGEPTHEEDYTKA